MDLQVIGTGSAGNAYVLRQDADALLLEAGLKWPDILSALPHGLRGIRGCLLTHEHKDHSKSVSQILKYGIKTVMSAGTWNAVCSKVRKIDTGFVRIVKAGDVITLPPFTVMAVQAMHDANEPLAYLIRHDGTGETALFATDTYILPNRYPGINYWFVECNYTEEKAQELLATPSKAPLYERLAKSHMSLTRLVEALKANDLSHTRTIVLIHISNERGDSNIMEATVKQATGIRTIAAKNGIYIKLGECPF